MHIFTEAIPSWALRAPCGRLVIYRSPLCEHMDQPVPQLAEEAPAKVVAL